MTPLVGLPTGVVQDILWQQFDGEPDQHWQQQDIIDIPKDGDEIWNQIDWA
jgi:hypothetical protein